jgi:preprotein translocase subunit SecE
MTTTLDNIKLGAAVALVGVGIWGYYWLADSPLILRVLAVAGGILVGGAVAWFTETGGRFVVFTREAIVEVKKVVWPSRKETVQTTGAVFAFVVVMAVFLWVSDKTLEWVLYDLILNWKR